MEVTREGILGSRVLNSEGELWAFALLHSAASLPALPPPLLPRGDGTALNPRVYLAGAVSVSPSSPPGEQS